MPNYDFNCPDCGNEFTELVPMDKRDEARECPKCGKQKCKRGVSAVKLSYTGFKSMYSRTSSGWNDVLKKIKKGSGKGNSIRTK